MIIYGYRTSNQVMGQLPQVCSYCRRTGLHTVVRSKRMFTLFWIPIFPIGKKTTMHCTLCGYQMQIDNAQADAYFNQQQAGAAGQQPGTPR